MPSQVPAFPIVVIGAGDDGADVEFPSGSTNPRSRSTPERAQQTRVEAPPGIPVNLTTNIVRQSQTSNVQSSTVRQEIAQIEQRLLMLRQMEQHNVVTNIQQQNMVHFNPQQQVQNNMTINAQNPVVTEIAFQALSNANQAAQQAQSQLLQAQRTVHQIEQ